MQHHTRETAPSFGAVGGPLSVAERGSVLPAPSSRSRRLDCAQTLCGAAPPIVLLLAPNWHGGYPVVAARHNNILTTNVGETLDGGTILPSRHGAASMPRGRHAHML